MSTEIKEATKTVSLLSLLWANPILIAAGCLILGVMFLVGYAVLWAFGLITATIFFVGGLLLIGIIGKVNREFLTKHWWLALAPIGLAGLGYFADHAPSLGGLSVTGSGAVTINPVMTAVVSIAISALLIGSAVMSRGKHKGKGKKRKK